MQPFFSPNGAYSARRSICRPRKLGTRTRHCSLVTELGVLGKKFWQVAASIAPYTFISHTNMPIFLLKGGFSSYILQSQPSKLMLETFSWVNDVNWVDRGTDKNRQSTTLCGFCCYYLEHCSKTNHIAIKWTKYENVYGLVASHKIWWSPNFFKTFGNLRDANKTSRVWYQKK